MSDGCCKNVVGDEGVTSESRGDEFIERFAVARFGRAPVSKNHERSSGRSRIFDEVSKKIVSTPRVEFILLEAAL